MTSFDPGAKAMCDFAFINLLREKVRQREEEERHLQAFGPGPSVRFVPWILTAQLPLKTDLLLAADRGD
jgi:hypothetical protein